VCLSYNIDIAHTSKESTRTPLFARERLFSPLFLPAALPPSLRRSAPRAFLSRVTDTTTHTFVRARARVEVHVHGHACENGRKPRERVNQIALCARQTTPGDATLFFHARRTSAKVSYSASSPTRGLRLGAEPRAALASGFWGSTSEAPHARRR
jgi:hypothetical protein